MEVNMNTQVVTARDIAAGAVSHAGAQGSGQAGGFLELMMQLCGSAKSGQQVNTVQSQEGLLAALKKKLSQETLTDDTLQMIAQMLMMTPEFAAENLQLAGDLPALVEQITAMGVDVPQLTNLLSKQEQLTPEMLTLLESLQSQQDMPAFTAVKNEAQATQTQDVLTGQSEFQTAVLKAQSMMGGKPTAQAIKEETPVNIETLQKDVESGKYLGAAAAVQPNGISENSFVKQLDTQTVSPQNVLEQVKTGIEQGVKSGANEFVIKLKPEGLGEITVHMVSTGGKIALNIVTSTAQTEKLLNSELINLRSILRPMNAEVQQISNQNSHSFDSATYHQSLFQQQQQSAYSNRGGRNFLPYGQFEAQEENSYVPQQSYIAGTSALDQYI
ncbi:flagellar hook-length control protein FliK [Hydrogenoanaerobacterium sp.]|uniref:flagellar hook-length control protein FliK n=1 Tax=Hydrogenoanaerobacterium sp. TaxID=2953763 RepID=UPI00289DAD95|nr:flagellar hook-length control protein FliK [Hydrogenoanaerobacterium sp.]